MRAVRLTLKATAITTAVLAGAFVWAVPRSPLPDLPGPHLVGTRTLVVGPDSRRLPVQVWYPTTAAAADGASHAAVIPGANRIATALAAETAVPTFALRTAALLRGEAFLDVPAADGEWPVVVLVHGWLGMRWVHSDIAEALASQGNVVIAADHVGGAIAAPFPDGDVTLLDSSLLPPEDAPDYWQKAEALVDLYAEDVIVLLDQMPAALSEAAIPSLPMDQVRVIGHSTGGGGAVRAAQLDDRIAGIVGLDPWVEPIGYEASVQTVANDTMLIAIRSTAWVGNSNDQLLKAMDMTELRTVSGTAHRDFTLLGWLSPVVRLLNVVESPPEPVYESTLQGFADLMSR